MLDDGTVDETLDDATVDDDSTTTVAELFKTKVVTQRLFHTNSGSGEPESHGPSTPHSVGKRRKLAEESTPNASLLSLSTILIERVSTLLRPPDFRSFAMICAEMHHALGRVAPGMTASVARGALELRDFQASNVRILTRQLLGELHLSQAVAQPVQSMDRRSVRLPPGGRQG